MIVLHVYIIINHDKVEESDHSRFDLWPLTPHKITLTFPFVIFLFSLLKNKIIKGKGSHILKKSILITVKLLRLYIDFVQTLKYVYI